MKDNAVTKAALREVDKTMRLISELEEEERRMQEEYELKGDVEELEGETPAVQSEAPPAMRDAATAMARLDRSSSRAERLATASKEMAFTVAAYESHRGEGPAYMHAAVKALREETRVCEVAVKMAQVMMSQQNYAFTAIRKKSWVGEDTDE